MTFEQYFILNESPDVVYTNSGTELKWANDDARAFGWLNIIPGVKPFLVYTTQSGATHYEIVFQILELFKYARIRDTGLIKRVFQREYKQYFDFYPSFNKVIDSLAQNKETWKLIVNGDIENEFNEKIGQVIGDEEKPVTTEMSERQLAFNDSGRIWLKEKVLSFWDTSASQETIKTVFNAFNINQEHYKEFLLDLIDPANIELEETKNKKLPTIQEYLTKNISSKKELTKDQQKRVAELLAKRHTETDPTKKKIIQKELEQYGQASEVDSTSQPIRIPLNIRQKAMTSEGILFKDFFKLSQQYQM